MSLLFRSDSLSTVGKAADEVLRRRPSRYEHPKGFVGGGLRSEWRLPRGSPVPTRSQRTLSCSWASRPRSVRPGARPARELRVAAGPQRPVATRLLPSRNDHARVAPVRGPRRLVRANKERLTAVGRPGLRVRGEPQTLPQGPRSPSRKPTCFIDVSRHGVTGTAAPPGRVSARPHELRQLRPQAQEGTTDPAPDSNSLDNPFFWTADPDADRYDARRSLHFVASPTSTIFHWARTRWRDGSAKPAPLDPRGREQGFNSLLRTTHRQNASSFPLRAAFVPTRRASRRNLNEQHGRPPRARDRA